MALAHLNPRSLRRATHKDRKKERASWKIYARWEEKPLIAKRLDFMQQEEKEIKGRERDSFNRSKNKIRVSTHFAVKEEKKERDRTVQNFEEWILF